MKQKLEKGHEIVYRFKTLADTKRNKHKVYLTFGEQLEINDPYNGIVLSISDTPGAWYLETLFEGSNKAVDYTDYMPIYGRNWNCYNWAEIVKELKEIALPKILPILQIINK